MARTKVFFAQRVFASKGHVIDDGGVAVRDDRVYAVFPRALVDDFVEDDAERVELGKVFVCPGFHDAHQHVLQSAVFYSGLGMKYAGTSEQDCVDHLRDFAAKQPSSDGWLLGQGWRDMLWDPPVAPTRASLDEVFPDRPVCLYSGDAHTIWLNMAGLRRLGITEDTEPPEGGSFERDADGHLTGVCREAAGMLYMARVFGEMDQEALRRAYASYFELLLSQGVTAVCDMGLSATPGADCVREDIYEGMLEEGRLPLRAHLFPQLVGDFSRIEGLQARLRGDRLRAPGMKQFFDGVSSAHTAWLTEPYANPYFPGDCGRPTVDPARMRELVMGAAERGIAVRIHTIGDRAIHEACQIFKDAYQAYGLPRQGANSLEHLENLLRPDVEALREANLIASVQPQHIVIDTTQPDRDLGPQRASFMWPFVSYLEAGVPMAFGTDSPCVDPLAWQVLYCAVTRQDPKTGEPAGGWLPEQRISMEDAIDAYTHGSARVVGRADELGSLEGGHWADFAVFDRDLLSVDPDELHDVHCLATYVGGEQVWGS